MSEQSNAKKAHTMRERAFEILQKDIIDGTLSPGERVFEDAIAERYQVSRTPLREAIRQLEQEGLLERFSGRGLRVARMSLREVTELYEMRARLEGLATLHATNNLGDVQRQELKTRLDESWCYDPQTRTTIVHDEMPWIHNFILKHCHHTICIDYLHRLNIRLERYRAMTTRQRKTILQAHREHSLIINCMLVSDSSGAELAMQCHIRIAFSLAQQIIASKIE